MLKLSIASARAWTLVTLVGAAIAFITFCLLGALLSPMENTHNLPVALVNGDQGVTAGNAQMNMGNEIVKRLTAPQQTDTLKWYVIADRETAFTGVRQNKYYAALVIPADYSASLMAIGAQTGAKPATIEILTNPAGPTLGGQTAQGALQGIVASLSKATGEQLTARVQAAKTPLVLPAATFLTNPIQTSVVPVATVGEHSGRGVNIFFTAILLVIAGILSAVLPKVFLTHMAADKKVGKWEMLAAHLTLSFMAAVSAVTGLLLTAGALNMDMPDWVSLGGFALLATVTVSWLIMAAQLTMGRAGIGVASLFLIILGLPSSGGLFPAESLPALWQWCNAVLPLRFIVDGLRSVLFLGSEFEGGLGNALLVLSGYAVAALAVVGLVVWLRADKPVEKSVQAQPTEPVAA
jgi:YhgE/Pip-like protein